jgi:hypothetical protein
MEFIATRLLDEFGHQCSGNELNAIIKSESRSEIVGWVLMLPYFSPPRSNHQQATKDGSAM